MATLATPPEHDLVQPVNRIAGLLPPPGKQAGRPPERTAAPGLAPARPPGGHRPGAVLRAVLRAALLAPLVVVAAALLASVLVPGVYVALVLLLVGLAPLVAVGLGVLATLDLGDGPSREPAP
jgi:hypothetical protein